jgi:GMP synthase-like glutamine amidotransferase
MRIHYLKHVPFEGPGIIKEWAEAEGHSVTATHLYRGEIVPELNDLDLLVVMGGPMGAGDDDRYPWMTAEKRFIEQAVKSDKSVLGI